MALVWPGGSVRLYVRSKENRFGVDVNEEQSFAGHVTPGSSVRLRIVVEASRIRCQTCEDDFLWETVKTIDRRAFPGAPSALRFGKLGPFGRPEDYATPGLPGSSEISGMKAWGNR